MADYKKNPQEKIDPNVRLIGQVALTSVLWAATFIATRAEWFTRATGVSPRIAGVVIGIGGFLPVLFVYAKSIRMQDEFNQRIHLLALAIAFAIIAAISYSADLLATAGFIPAVPSTGLWALMIGVWFVTMIVTPRFYR